MGRRAGSRLHTVIAMYELLCSFCYGHNQQTTLLSRFRLLIDCFNTHQSTQYMKTHFSAVCLIHIIKFDRFDFKPDVTTQL